MPGIKKKNQYVGLDRLNVYKEDTSRTSKYFKVSDVPDSLPIGKSSFGTTIITLPLDTILEESPYK